MEWRGNEMITKDWVIINRETKMPYAQRDTFIQACEVANRKVNGQVITREDWLKIKEDMK